ncbi:MAG: glycosyltransferase [Candidatus Doudnabacteria bacterium]|nr:glycosyltransferase [Candidatus Doudnabacteria bacterium]
MKVLFCGLKYEYGKPESGLSFEYRNFFETLQAMPELEVEMFAVDERLLAVGREKMNEELKNSVVEKQPDLLFCFLYTDEINKEIIEYITKKTKTKTFNWFADDHWRFEIFSRLWAPLFTAVSTTDSEAVLKYRSIGVNIIKTQWAANIHLYKPSLLPATSYPLPANNITFVGKNYGNRSKYINALKVFDLPAVGYGAGWEKGRVSFEDMLKIFSNSKINLNFTQSAFANFTGKFKMLAKTILHPYNAASYMKAYAGAQRNQIKGRTFEIPACGGFMLTQDADNLGEYYEDGKEVVIFKNEDDMIEKCKYYLSHENERVGIAKAGYKRTLKEHTYELRFREIFNKIFV